MGNAYSNKYCVKNNKHCAISLEGIGRESNKDNGVNKGGTMDGGNIRNNKE